MACVMALSSQAKGLNPQFVTMASPVFDPEPYSDRAFGQAHLESSLPRKDRRELGRPLNRAVLVPRLISSVPNNDNLKFGKNAPYLTHFPETRKPEIRISKLEMVRPAHHPEQSRRTKSNEQNTNYQNGKTTGPAQLCFEF
jgi:hypothetical protein